MLKVIISPAKKMNNRSDILPYKDVPYFLHRKNIEYSKSVLKYIPSDIRVITCVFGKVIDGKIKEKGTYAKMARGSLSGIWSDIRLRI